MYKPYIIIFFLKKGKKETGKNDELLLLLSYYSTLLLLYFPPHVSPSILYISPRPPLSRSRCQEDDGREEDVKK